MWSTADGDFDQQLFAQFANLNLTLLRDGVQNGASWGWTPAIIASNQQKLTSKITAYTQYAQQDLSTRLQQHRCQYPVRRSQLPATAAAEGWEAERQAYWSDLKAR